MRYLMGNRELVALLCLSSLCFLIVVWLFLAVPRVCLQFVIVVFPDHTHLLFIGWESLQNRRTKHKLITFYKMKNGLAPNYLCDLVPVIIRETTNYNLRNADSIQTLHACTNLHYNSFFQSTIRAWNSLAENTMQTPSISSFKF